MVIIVIAAMCGSYVALGAPVDSGNKSEVLVRVRPGSGTAQIAATLKDKGLIKSEAVFRLKARTKAPRFQAGTYSVNRSMSSSEIVDLIASGRTAGKTFTITEGQPLYKIADQLDKAGIVKEKDFYREVKKGKFDYGFMKYLPSGETRLEGFLYPDTYTIPLDATAHEVIDMMLKRFNEVAGDKDDLYKTVIKASVIQKEAGNADEMRKVSSVIDNRIRKGMPLQMDSIISYIHKQDKIRATYKDIEVDSAYNPYKNKGLPPGPICSPGKQALLAASDPAHTDYLYFVASPKMDGTNVFSATSEQFMKDKEKFDKAYEKYIKEHPGEE